MIKLVRALSRTKLYWGLLLICLVGALASPHSSSGSNIFLSYGNLTDVLRQVSITGLVATGMTMVILTRRHRPVGRLGDGDFPPSSAPCC